MQPATIRLVAPGAAKPTPLPIAPPVSALLNLSPTELPSPAPASAPIAALSPAEASERDIKPALGARPRENVRPALAAPKPEPMPPPISAIVPSAPKVLARVVHNQIFARLGVFVASFRLMPRLNISSGVIARWP